jgi:mRNA interferase MazF
LATTKRFNPGDVVTLNFMGAVNAKRRPGIIVSSSLYHQNRPDVIVAILTTNIAASITPLDYILQDWATAGLRQPSAYRSYFNMELPAGLIAIGKLSDKDWREVQLRLEHALSTT